MDLRSGCGSSPDGESAAAPMVPLGVLRWRHLRGTSSGTPAEQREGGRMSQLFTSHRAPSLIISSSSTLASGYQLTCGRVGDECLHQQLMKVQHDEKITRSCRLQQKPSSCEATLDGLLVLPSLRLIS